MRKFWIVTAFLLLIFSAVCAFTYGAIEPFGRNIIYVHVPTAVASLVFFAAVFVFSILYLAKRDLKWDLFAARAALTGFIFSILMNLTGIIFSQMEWNVWWTPSPRLVSSAILSFLYLAYILLRASAVSANKKAKLSAVFGIIAFADVPVVLITARFLPDIHQPNFSFENPWQHITLITAIIGVNILGFVFTFFRTRVKT